MSKETLTIICLGDVVGRPGRKAVASVLGRIREERAADLCIVNGENASGGIGLDPGGALELQTAGAQIITLGDHTWKIPELRPYLDHNSSTCIRPANYPDGAAGRGWAIWEGPGGCKVGVMNLIGRVFFNTPLDCPFRAADEILAGPLKGCDITVCDFHAEATSEKYGMGRYLDGRVSLVVGTHTHVQTSDAHILPGGTAYITDLGMCGVPESVIGMDSKTAITRFVSGIPSSYKIAKGAARLHGIAATIDIKSGKGISIEAFEA